MCQFPSVFMFITSMFPLLPHLGPLFPPFCLMLILFPTYIGSMNGDIIHQVILSSQVRRVMLRMGATLGKDHIR